MRGEREGGGEARTRSSVRYSSGTSGSLSAWYLGMMSCVREEVSDDERVEGGTSRGVCIG